MPFKISTAPAAGANPVQKFRGRLKAVTDREVTYQEGQPDERKSAVVDFDFENVQVLRSTEPYTFPILKITLPYANPQTDRGNSRWAVWASSARRAFGGRTFEIEEIIAKDQDWEQLPMKTRLQYNNLTDDEKTEQVDKFLASVEGKDLSDDAISQGRKAVEAGWYEVERLGWQVVNIAGVSGAASNGTGADLMDYLAGVAEGRKEQEYYMALVADQKVTPHQEIIADITGGKLVDKMMLLGKITRDPDGTLHTMVAAS